MLETQEQRKQKTQTGKQLVMSAADVLRDYNLAVQSRQASVIGRREVMNGRAKFGIFGDGKEIAQIAMAKSFPRVISGPAITAIRRSCSPSARRPSSNSSPNSMPTPTWPPIPTRPAGR
jgi:hypothetical protein